MQALVANAEQIREELALGPILESALATMHQGDRMKSIQLTARSKRMCYVSGVVSIYGLIEETVSNLLIELATISQGMHERYSDLPQRIQTAHRELSLKALLEGERARLRIPLNAKSTLQVLAANEVDADLLLNKSAFTLSSANYRHRYIVELLGRLDIEAGGCVQQKAVADILDRSGLQFRDAETLLIDLVDRRNQVAHSFSVPELLDAATLDDYLTIVAKYLAALILKSSHTVLQKLARVKLKSLGRVTNRWTSAFELTMTAGELQSPLHVLVIKGDRLEVLEVATLESDSRRITGRIQFAGTAMPIGMGTTSSPPRWIKDADLYVLPEQWTHLVV